MTSSLLQANALRAHHLFASLGDEQLARIVDSAHVQSLAEGEHLFGQGQPCEYFYLLRSGCIKLCRFSPDGHEKVIDIVMPGQTFAEAIMFMERQTYPVTSVSVGASEIIAFRNGTFREIVRESADTAFQLLGDMSRRLRKQLNEINALTLQNATLRFINYLLQQLPEGSQGTATIALAAPKNVIASRLSIQPESFSRILRHLQKDGLIGVEGTCVHIGDVERLRALTR